MKENLIKEKSYQFALKIISLYQSMVEKREFVLSKQLLRSGTSNGANVEEALAGQSRADFLSKMSIASKEASECNYWLRLIRDSNLVIENEIEPYLEESDAILRILTSIVKSTHENIIQNQKFKIKNRKILNF
ncbi:MAG: four helix bundle protein [Candidatus Omnitrophota bacterium]